MRTADGYIINRCLDGDTEAFGLLVDKYKAGIYALAYGKIGNPQDAEDITQEAFLKAYRNLRKLKRWDNFFAWLYSITSNLCKDWLSSQSRRPDREYVEMMDAETVGHSSLYTYRDGQVRESLHEALAALPEIYRQVLTLYYLGGMSSMEIAEFLGTSPTTIHTRLSRARTLLKEEMLTMMSTTFNDMKLQPAFTFRIVEMIKRTKIQPGPQTPAIPIGLSITAGLMIALLSLTMPFDRLIPIGRLIGSPLPSEMKVAEVGEIPVDVVEVTEAPIFSSERGNGKLGGAPQSPHPLNAAFAAQGDEPRPPEGGWLNAPGKANALAEAPDHPSLDEAIGREITIEAWIYLSRRPQVGERWTILEKVGSYSMEVFAWPNDPILTIVRIQAGGQSVQAQVSPKEWIHGAGVFKEGGIPSPVGALNAGLYRNGQLIGHVLPPMGKIPNTDSPVRVGRNFDGAIDQVRISKIARYTEGFLHPLPIEAFKPDEHTAALWQFEDGEAADQFQDDSGNGNHLRPRGGIKLSEERLENQFDVFLPQARAWFRETKMKILATGESFDVPSLFLIDGETLTVQRLKGSGREVRWSSDGKQIAVAQFEAKEANIENWPIYVMDAGGRNARKVTEHSVIGWGFAPAWSPDGVRIAFTDGDRPGAFGLFVVDLLSGEISQLTDTPGNDVSPVWSPDGRQIAFISDRTGHQELYLMDSQGKAQQQITVVKSGYINGCSWAPDSKTLIFASLTQDRRMEMMKVQLPENKLTPFHIENGPDFGIRPPALFWLPDGKHIVFQYGNGFVYRVDVDGKNLTPILKMPSGTPLQVNDWHEPDFIRRVNLPVDSVGKRLTTFGEIKRTALLQNFPNPFNPETWIPYRLAADAPVSISIYDARGALIRQLHPGVQAAGSYLTPEKAAYWDGRDLHGEPVSSGVYFYRLDAGDFTATRKMVVVK